MKKFKIILGVTGISVLVLFFSCGQKQVTEAVAAESQSAEIVATSMVVQDDKADIPEFKDVSKDTKEHVNRLLETYSAIKNALVRSDFSKTNEKTDLLIEEIVAFNNKKALKGEQDAYYLKVGAKLKNNGERIKKSKDLEEQRNHFTSMTSDLYKIVKAFGGNSQDVFYQYCPMAFNDTGGYWLSLKKEIENPYFGDRMLKCGMVKETIKAKN